MKDNNIKKLPVVLNNEIVGIVTETNLTRTIEVFSEAIGELEKIYEESKDTIEKIMDEWGNILYSLKGFGKTTENKQENVIENKITS